MMAEASLALFTLLYFFWFVRLSIERYICLVFIVFVFSGLLNRIIIYFSGDFSGVSNYIIITVTIPLWMKVVKRINVVPRFIILKLILLFALIVALYFVIGLITSSVISSIYTFATLLNFQLFLILPYIFNIDKLRLEKLFSKTLNLTGLIVIPYGLFQFITGPNIVDKYWLENAEFSSLGLPLPFLIKPFSVTSAPGSYALYLLIFIFFALWRRSDKNNNALKNLINYLIIFIAVVALFTTGVRSVLALVLSVIVITLLAEIIFKIKVFGIVPIIIGASLLSALGSKFFNYFQEAEYLKNRITSFDSTDTSLNARLGTYKKIIDDIAENPFGYGLGSSGRFSTDQLIIDQGYLELCYQMGILPTAFFLCLLVILLFRKTTICVPSEQAPKMLTLTLGKIYLLSILILMNFGTVIFTSLGWYLAFLCSVSNVNYERGKTFENCNNN